MSQSILNSTKKVLGLAPDYSAFDEDVILFINAALSNLTQVGVGPANGVTIADSTATWDLLPESVNTLSAAKSYVALCVKLAFDPPQNSFTVAALEKQLSELLWRINVSTETSIIDEDTDQTLIIDGGVPH
jgi:hypothetical protein